MAIQHLNNNEIFNIFKDKKIAIVGNSPSLKNSKKGTQIDSYDIVVRFNDSVIYTPKFKEDYGSKTDVWSINGWSSYVDIKYPGWNDINKHKIPIKTILSDNNFPHSLFLQNSKPVVLGSRPLVRPTNHLMLERGLYMRGPMFDLIKDIIPFSLKYIDIPNEIFKLDFLNGHFNISSGLAVILLIIHFSPKEINLFGFNFLSYKESTHYYEDKFNYTKDQKVFSTKNLYGAGHNGKFEKELVTRISKDYNIKIN